MLGVSLFAKLNKLPFLGIKAEANIDLNYTKIGQNLITKTISNTILTDYLEKAIEDKNITKFIGYKLSAHPESLTYAKMYTPYTLLFKDENQNINLSMLDKVLENAKGYYELIAQNEDTKCVLRFNINAFRNNYNLSDLIKMDLFFHAIYVGNTTEEQLSAENEFNPEGKTLPTPLELLDETTPVISNSLKVYDVIFAGVELGEKNE
jgi:hypothetical protein